jgi:hypothetical protein
VVPSIGSEALVRVRIKKASSESNSFMVEERAEVLLIVWLVRGFSLEPTHAKQESSFRRIVCKKLANYRTHHNCSVWFPWCTIARKASKCENANTVDSRSVGCVVLFQNHVDRTRI